MNDMTWVENVIKPDSRFLDFAISRVLFISVIWAMCMPSKKPKATTRSVAWIVSSNFKKQISIITAPTISLYFLLHHTYISPKADLPDHK